MKDQFNNTSTRDKEAAEYFSSREFFNLMDSKAKGALVNKGSTFGMFRPDIAPKPQDMPYIQQVFNDVKKEYPELDHVSLAWGEPSIILDTKKDTLHRRIRMALFP